MSCHRTSQLGIVLIAALCGGICSQPVQSAEAQGTIRYFFEFLPQDGGGHDWEAENSRRIVTRDPDTSTRTLTFGAPDFVYTFPSNYWLYDAHGQVVLDLTNTTWVETSVAHITGNGVETVRSVYWLVTEADLENLHQSLSGLTAATGPDGDVAVQPDVSLSSDAYSSQYISFGGGNPVRFSVGRFQK